ncbi:MAG: gephyrin-like molybdotransferase Glp [Chloroflexota bacterium]
MLSVHEAQQRILSFFSKTELISIPLIQSEGRVLAQDCVANIDLPPFDNSAMDGFAVITQDTIGATIGNPVYLKVVADIPAGSNSDVVLSSGMAARIMTGASIPSGADAVVMVEATDYDFRTPGIPLPEIVAIFQPADFGAHIRYKGDDIRTGQIIIQSGSNLRPQDLGILAMVGMDQVQVHRAPVMALISSGDELITADAPLTDGKIRDANTYTLTSSANKTGTQVFQLGIVPDNKHAIQLALDRAVEEKVDMIVSSAGVSVGAFDFIREVVEERGRLDFWRVNVRPGKPLAFGSYGNIPFFGLPGNPVSAFIGFELFVRPVLQKMSGYESYLRPRQVVYLEEGITSDGRESYLRAILNHRDGRWIAKLTGHQGSGNLLSLVRANALLIVPSGVKSLAAGTNVEAWFI